MKDCNRREAMYKGHLHFARKTNNSLRSLCDFLDVIRFSEQDGIMKYHLPETGMVTESLAVARKKWRHHIMLKEFNENEQNRSKG